MHTSHMLLPFIKFTGIKLLQEKLLRRDRSSQLVPYRRTSDVQLLVIKDVHLHITVNNLFIGCILLYISLCPFLLTLWGDKVSMLTHIYPHKPQRKIAVTICKITRLTAHFMCGQMSDLLICKFIKTYGHT